MIVTRTLKRNLAIVVAVAVLLCAVYWPVLRWMVNSWLSSDYYSHGFLVPLVSAFIIWTKRDQLLLREPSAGGIYLIVLGAVLYVLSFFWQMRVLGALSLIVVIAGLVLAVWGSRTFRAFLFPLFFLLFMVPFWFIQDIAYSLQYISVQWGRPGCCHIGSSYRHLRDRDILRKYHLYRRDSVQRHQYAGSFAGAGGGLFLCSKRSGCRTVRAICVSHSHRYSRQCPEDSEHHPGSLFL